MVALIECRAEISRSAFAAVDAAFAEHGLTHWTLYEDVLVGRAWLIGVSVSGSEARAAWSDLRPLLPRRGIGPPQWREMADQDWRESYKAHFKAWRCGTLHWVPEWERPSHRIPRRHVAVYLDPGLAFGTGNHETTRLCCRRLVEFARDLKPRARRSWRVIDAGCGSGILGISAAKLGCSDVYAFDNDADAVAIARENIRKNQVRHAVRTGVGGLETRLRGQRKANLVLANIQADILMTHAAVLLGAVAAGGRLILSGILAEELATVRGVFKRMTGPGWRIHSRRLGEWADLAADAPGRGG